VIRSIEGPTLPVQCNPLHTKRSLADVQLEPLPRLEWSLATEANPSAGGATAPAALRRSWIHRAPENQVLHLFRQLNGAQRELPAPWWLKALDRGELPSRATGFAIEDEVHALLSTRQGWVYLPWGGIAEAGYWEYGPSDRAPMTMPTTVVLTDAHAGWVDVVAAHVDTAPLALPMNGVSGLASALVQIESW
jgi:hypothetical protein